MTEAGAGPARLPETALRVASLILALIIVIFYLDVITPLGLSVWILYFIPLFLTLYWGWRYGPFFVTGVAIVLIAASLFLSPGDVSFAYALANRVFFALLLVAADLLIWYHKESESALRKSEERYRNLAEFSPDAVMVYRDGAVLYANPASLRLFGADRPGDLAGRDILAMIDGDNHALVRERFAQAELGARIPVPGVGIVRPDGSMAKADLSLGELAWDGRPAVLVVARAVPA